MKRKKILYIHPSNELYGADRSLLRLVRGLDYSLYEPLVVLPNDIDYEGALSDQFEISNIQYFEYPLAVMRRRYFSPIGMLYFFLNFIRSGIYLSRIIKREGVDLIHTNSSAVLSGGLASLLSGVPHIWHVREIIEEPKWFKSVIGSCLNWMSDIVVTVSQPVSDNLISGQSKLQEKIRKIHNGINPEPFLSVDPADTSQLKDTWGVPEDSILIGMIGRFSAWKGQDFLLKAAKDLLVNNKNIYLALIGGDVPGETQYREKVVELAKAFNITDQVILDQFRLDVPVVLSTFDIFVLPSTRPDPFPTTVLEGMASGRPIVSTKHGGAIEQIVDKESGLHVDYESPKEMSDALTQLVRDVELRVALGNSARNRLLIKFTVEHYLKNIQDLYSEILACS